MPPGDHSGGERLLEANPWEPRRTPSEIEGSSSGRADGLQRRQNRTGAMRGRDARQHRRPRLLTPDACTSHRLRQRRRQPPPLPHAYGRSRQRRLRRHLLRHRATLRRRLQPTPQLPPPSPRQTQRTRSRRPPPKLPSPSPRRQPSRRLRIPRFPTHLPEIPVLGMRREFKAARQGGCGCASRLPGPAGWPVRERARCNAVATPALTGAD
jgi:hypothetical protein